MIQPTLTYIDQPEVELAEIVFNLLEKLINKEIDIDSSITKEVKARINYRESTK